ncbi:MAG: flagellar motor switch phosphatase FliY [Candidatus Sericytochromatia bacterium]|nr:flagellar motor switch phosphatase FliY [Candidatus Sericytochromatia bacterium]
MTESTNPTPLGPLEEAERASFSDLSNYALGASASTMSMLLNKTVQFAVAEVRAGAWESVVQEHGEPMLLVSLDFQIGRSFPHLFLLKPTDAAILCDLMMGGDGTTPPAELGDEHLSAVGEAFNQGLGNAANTLSTLMLRRVGISAPRIAVEMPAMFAAAATLFPDGALTLVRHQFKIENLLDSELLELVPDQAAREMVQILQLAADDPEAAKAAAERDEAAAAGVAEATVPQAFADDLAASAVSGGMAAGLADLPGGLPPGGLPPGLSDLPGGLAPAGLTAAAPGALELAMAAGAFPQQDAVAVKQAQFAPLTRQPSGEGISGLDLILDVALKVTVELGRTRLPIRDILDLGKGSVVELDKLAGEPVDMLVNGKLIAKGEVVVIDESFGIRLTEIVSPQERFNHLKL